MGSGFDAALLPEALGTCACCVLESMDAAGVSLDCVHALDEGEEDAWHTP